VATSPPQRYKTLYEKILYAGLTFQNSLYQTMKHNL